MEDRINKYEFSYSESKNKVIIYWRNKQVMILKDNKALKLLNRISYKNENEIQMELAKITGNFKRDNEKR
jgi:hypothetical protein